MEADAWAKDSSVCGRNSRRECSRSSWMNEVGELDYDHRLFVSVCEAVIDPKEFEYAKRCGNGRPKADDDFVLRARLEERTDVRLARNEVVGEESGLLPVHE